MALSFRIHGVRIHSHAPCRGSSTSQSASFGVDDLEQPLSWPGTWEFHVQKSRQWQIQWQTRTSLEEALIAFGIAPK